MLDTIDLLLRISPRAREILVVDQTEQHEPATMHALQSWESTGEVRWIRSDQPSVTHAMNMGLDLAVSRVVLFVDDDIIPAPGLVAAHANAHREEKVNIVAGQVLQPGEEEIGDPGDGSPMRFCSSRRRWAEEFIGCNFSVKRKTALDLGGFDENFVQVAYRYEAEFCDRALCAGERVLFEPTASIRHLKAGSGGTRSYGNHLTTVRPGHAVGAYYYLLRARRVRHRFWKVLLRPFRSVRTKYHLTHPWGIPGTLLAELLGLAWAIRLAAGKPRLIGSAAKTKDM